jgi:hypothetical protein
MCTTIAVASARHVIARPRAPRQHMQKALTQLAECDQEIEQQLQSLQVYDGEPAKGKKRGRSRNAPRFDLHRQLFKICGVDLTGIDGIDVTTALAVISQTGTDMSRFATEPTSGVCAHAWTNPRQRQRCAQTGATDLYDAHPGREIYQSGAGVL